MDAQKIIKELRAERDRVDRAIYVLEQDVASHGKKRRGRPPKWLAEARKKAPPKKSR